MFIVTHAAEISLAPLLCSHWWLLLPEIFPSLPLCPQLALKFLLMIVIVWLSWLK